LPWQGSSRQVSGRSASARAPTTRHPPASSRELRRYDEAHPDPPLYLVQGVVERLKAGHDVVAQAFRDLPAHHLPARAERKDVPRAARLTPDGRP
jgi:hypothetical protein